MTDAEQNAFLNRMNTESMAFNARWHFEVFKKALFQGEGNTIEETAVMKALNDALDSGDFLETLPAQKRLYRSRIIKADYDAMAMGARYDTNRDTFLGFDADHSKEAPINISPGGRNNIRGVSYLYVASDEHTACAEVKPILGQVLSVAEFEVQKDLHIINFSEDRHVSNPQYYAETYSVAPEFLFAEIMFEYSKPAISKDDYIVSQYLSDYIRKTGIDGVCYRSHFTTGTNYTIFNCCENNIAFRSSHLVYTSVPDYHFFDLNTKEELTATRSEDALDKHRAASIGTVRTILADHLRDDYPKDIK